MAASTSGYGSASTSLLSTTQAGVSSDSIGGYVTTASDGTFSLTGDYACTPGSQIYVLARGGNPSLPPGTNNAALSLMAALGTCPSGGNFATSMPSIAINEVTTVASAYALRGFMTDATHISTGSSASAVAGLATAFATVSNVVDLSTGTALTKTSTANGSNGTVPAANINALANILAGCVQSDGTVSACTQLFANAAAGTSVPADTLTAILNVANAPSAHVSALYALSTYTSAPFQPSLSAQPNDLTLSIIYRGGAVNNASTPAVDSAGNIWIPNRTGASVSVLTPLGSFLSGAAGYALEPARNPQQIAFDAHGNAIISTTGLGAVSVLSASGALITPANGFNATGFNGSSDSAVASAVDASDTLWILDATSRTLGEFSTTGTAIAANAFGSGSLSQPTALAIDSAGNIVVADSGSSSLVRFSSTGAPAMFSSTSSATLSGGGLNAPSALALDQSDNIWVANANNTLSEFDKSGNVLSGTGFVGGGLSLPLSLAADGAGHLWLTNNTGHSISHFDNTGHAVSSISGYSVPGSPVGIALDSSGNVWVTSNDTTGSYVVEFIGSATPVSTPTSPGHAGTRP